jgi:PAS domain S-box-containing protein
MSKDRSRSFQSSPSELNEINGDAIAGTASPAIHLREDGHVVEFPALLFEQLPFAIYICDRNGVLLRYNRRAAELWGRSPKLGDPDELFCGSYRMFRPDGSPLPHHECPMADVLRTGISVRQQEVHIERPDGLRGVALVDIEAVRDSDGNIIGAINCFQDITERKAAEVRERILARELDHRAKNLLTLVQATVRLTRADTITDFKAAIEGRLQPLSNAHSLLAQSRWAGVYLHSLVMEELTPYRAAETSRADISGPTLVLQPKSAQSIAIVLHELMTNAVKYGALSVPSGRLRVEWSPGETEITIRLSEENGPPVNAPAHTGVGTRLVGSIVQSELNGRLRFDWKPDGVACEIVIPLAHVAGALSNAHSASPLFDRPSLNRGDTGASVQAARPT